MFAIIREKIHQLIVSQSVVLRLFSSLPLLSLPLSLSPSLLADLLRALERRSSVHSVSSVFLSPPPLIFCCWFCSGIIAEGPRSAYRDVRTRTAAAYSYTAVQLIARESEMSLIRTLWRCAFSPRLFTIYEVTPIGLVDVSTTHLFSISTTDEFT